MLTGLFIGTLLKFFFLTTPFFALSMFLAMTPELTEEELGRLRAIRNLAPGDFRTVRQERFYLDEQQTNLQLIEALEEECSLKKDGSSVSKIGF